MRPILILIMYLLLCKTGESQLSVCCNKTTSIVFPYAIKSVDRGSKDILVQKAKGVDNILLVKAAIANFQETNLSVITADGKLYTLMVNYVLHPASFKLYFEKDSADHESVQAVAQKLSYYPKNVTGIKDKKFDIVLRLKGLYIHDDIIYYVLELQNESAVGYDIESLRFFIKDKNQNKRTASQELAQVPLYIYGNTSNIKGNSNHVIVVALRKFTIPDKKLLYVQLMENNGGRHLQIKVSNQKIIKAKNIN